MIEVLVSLKDTPVPDLLVLAGLVFIFVAVVGKFTAQVSLPLHRQFASGILGLALLATGIVLFLLPSEPSAVVVDTSATAMPNSSPNTPQRTSVTQASSAATPSQIPTPTIPLYDDFSESELNLDKWMPAPWQTDSRLLPTISTGRLAFELQHDNGQFSELFMRGQPSTQQIFGLMTIDETQDGAIGIQFGTWEIRYNISISACNGIMVTDNETVIDTLPIPRFIGCPSTHLLGAVYANDSVSLFFDGDEISSYHISGTPVFAGILVQAGTGGIQATVDAIWAEF